MFRWSGLSCGTRGRCWNPLRMIHPAFPGKDVPVRELNGHGIHGAHGTHRCPPVTIPLFHLTCSLMCTAQRRQPPWGWRGTKQEMGGAGVRGFRGFRGSSGVGWKDRESSLRSLAPKFPEEPEKRPGHCPGRNNGGGWFCGLCGVPESHQSLALRAFTQLFKRPLANLADTLARYAH